MPGLNWERIREDKLYANPLCEVCYKLGLTNGAVEIDHIVPVSLGGNNDIANLQSICRECHEKKTARENAYRLPVNADGYPSIDLRKQILVRREKHKERIKEYWRGQFRARKQAQREKRDAWGS